MRILLLTILGLGTALLATGLGLAGAHRTKVLGASKADPEPALERPDHELSRRLLERYRAAAGEPDRLRIIAEARAAGRPALVFLVEVLAQAESNGIRAAAREALRTVHQGPQRDR